MDELSHSRTSTPTQNTRNVQLTPERQSRSPEGSPTSVSPPGSPGYLGYTLSLSLRPSYASISSLASDCSVFTTATATSSMPCPTTVGQNQEACDDDETRTMRRLLLRRIEAQLRAAYDEVDRVVNWISIVQDVVGGVKRRTYL